jgi:hypothetical protein
LRLVERIRSCRSHQDATSATAVTAATGAATADGTADVSVAVDN